MKREEFEQRIQRLVPGVSEDILSGITAYAAQWEEAELGPADQFYDAYYVELALTNRDFGEEVTGRVLELNRQSRLNPFEILTAARLLSEGRTEREVADYNENYGCLPTQEEREEFHAALRQFLNGEEDSWLSPESPPQMSGPEMG